MKIAQIAPLWKACLPSFMEAQNESFPISLRNSCSMLTRLSNPQLLEAAVENGAQAALVKGDTSAEVLEKAILKALSTLRVNLTSHAEPEPPVLLMCHRCRLVHGEEGGRMTEKTYREATGIDPVTCRLTHTDCPFCHDFLLCHPQAA